MDNNVSLKEFIAVQFEALRSELQNSHKALLEKIDANEEQNKVRRHDTLAQVTALKAKQEAHEKAMEEQLNEWRTNQTKINTRTLIWISILSMVVVLSLIGLASEAGSLLGILINAF